MPAEPASPTTPFEVSPITDQDLQKPGPLGRYLARSCEDLKGECRQQAEKIEVERAKREQITKDFHSADSECKVLEARLEVLNNRDAISQLLWGTVSVITAMLIEFVKSQQGVYIMLCAAADALLVGAVLLLHGYKKKTEPREQGGTAGEK